MAVTLAQRFIGGLFFRGTNVVDFTPVRGTTDTAYPLAYTISPALPAGLTLNPVTGRITGAPTVAGNMTSYSITVTEITTAQYVFTDNVTANLANYNLRTRAIAAGWNGSAPLKATVTIAAGVVISSATPATPAFATGALPNGSDVTVTNNGLIRGSNAIEGTTTYGGVALNVTYPIKLAMSMSGTVSQAHNGVTALNGFIIGGNGVGAPTFVNPMGNDGTGTAGAAIVGGALIDWQNRATINNVYGPVDDWGTYTYVRATGLEIFMMGANTKPVQVTRADASITTWTGSLPADWYWDNNQAGSTSQAVKGIKLRMFAHNNTGAVRACKLTGAVDDKITQLKVNTATVNLSSQMGPSQVYDSPTFNLANGLNIIEITVENATSTGLNVAGCSLELRDTANTVLEWRNSWKIIPS